MVMTEWTFGDSFADMPKMFALGMIAVGLIECFLGFKIFKIQVAVVSFFAGIVLGYQALGVTVHSVLGIIAGVVLGAALSVVSFKIYKAGVFIFVGLWIGLLVDALSGYWWVGLLAGLVAGAIGMILVKPALIISSSIAGGVFIAAGVLGLIGQDWQLVFTIGSIALAVLGLGVQFETNKHAPMQGEYPKE